LPPPFTQCSRSACAAGDGFTGRASQRPLSSSRGAGRGSWSSGQGSFTDGFGGGNACTGVWALSGAQPQRV
jgi:hypothetical protein